MQKKHILLALVIFGFFMPAASQSLSKTKLDSLLVVWNNVSRPDTIRLNAVHTIAKEGYRFNIVHIIRQYGCHIFRRVMRF